MDAESAVRDPAVAMFWASLGLGAPSCKRGKRECTQNSGPLTQAQRGDACSWGPRPKVRAQAGVATMPSVLFGLLYTSFAALGALCPLVHGERRKSESARERQGGYSMGDWPEAGASCPCRQAVKPSSEHAAKHSQKECTAQLG